MVTKFVMGTWLYNLSIKGKLGAIILASSILLLALISTALIANEFVRLKYNLGSDLTALAEIIGTNSAIGLAFDDAKASEEVLNSLVARPNIVYAQVFDIKGKIFARYERAGASPKRHENILAGEEAVYVRGGRNGELEIPDSFSVYAVSNYAVVVRKITRDGRLLGGILIHSDLGELKSRLLIYIGTMLTVMLIALALTLIIAARLQGIITTPVYRLRDTVQQVSDNKNYRLRVEKSGNDEIGQLIDGFNGMLAKIERGDHEIRTLNELLRAENRRLGAEIEITRRLQKMVLPTPEELRAFSGLDIAGYMDPADEVGGDYYDVLKDGDSVRIAIGDVTGHGLESGVVMLMVQMAVRTLLASDIRDARIFLNVINKALFGNVRRMKTDKNLTLSLLNYDPDGKLCFTGQHEELLVARQGGGVERMDTLKLGFMVGLLPDIGRFVSHAETRLEPGDGVVLYTDGITEAHNEKDDLYGIERLCAVVGQHWQASADAIQQAVITDVRKFTGGQKMLDDMTLLVLKRLV